MIVSATTAKIRNLVKIKEIKNISHKETKLGQEEMMLSSQREKRQCYQSRLDSRWQHKDRKDSGGVGLILKKKLEKKRLKNKT